jgi:hypothetical protein
LLGKQHNKTMRYKNPISTYTRGEFIAEVFENVKPDELHIVIFKTGIKVCIHWESAKKIFFHLHMEGLLDMYPYRKLVIEFPVEELATGELRFETIDVKSPGQAGTSETYGTT